MKKLALLLTLLVAASCAPKVTVASPAQTPTVFVLPQVTNSAVPSTTPVIITPTPATDTLPANDAALFYMIKRTDTLEGIAAKFGMSVDQLAGRNDPEMIRRFRPDTSLALYDRELIWQRINSEPGKKVVVVIGEQKAYAVDGNQLVHDPFTISTGRAAHPSPVGKFAIITKLESMLMQGPKDGGGQYHLPGVPYDMNFHSVFYLHGAPWNHSLGQPYSGGCVNFSVEDAKWVYDWTDPKPSGPVTYATKANPGTVVWVIP